MSRGAAMLLFVAGCSAGHDPVAKCDDSWNAGSAQHPRAALYRAALDKNVSGVLPGAVLGIHDADGTWFGAAGSADIDHGVAMQVCHSFPIGSVTKTFAATLMLKLAESGQLDLDAPIAPNLPAGVARKILNSGAITARMLLNHSSGVPNYTDFNLYVSSIADPGHTLTRDQAIDRIAGRSDFTPGSQTGYSNSNTLLAGIMVEQLTGESFKQVLGERVLDPVGLPGSSYDDEGPFVGTVRAYLDIDGRKEFIDSNWSNYLITLRDPSSAMISTARDLVHFVDALQRDQTVLQPASLTQMRTGLPGGNVKDHEAAFGLGLVQYDFGAQGKAWGHAGVVMGATARTYSFPDRNLTLVLLVNGFSQGYSGGVEDYLEHTMVPSLLAVAEGT
jgi:D-alanyl-D-alanine carboxypeptidase